MRPVRRLCRNTTLHSFGYATAVLSGGTGIASTRTFRRKPASMGETANIAATVDSFRVNSSRFLLEANPLARHLFTVVGHPVRSRGSPCA